MYSHLSELNNLYIRRRENEFSQEVATLCKFRSVIKKRSSSRTAEEAGDNRWCTGAACEVLERKIFLFRFVPQMCARRRQRR